MNLHLDDEVVPILWAAICQSAPSFHRFELSDRKEYLKQILPLYKMTKKLAVDEAKITLELPPDYVEEKMRESLSKCIKNLGLTEKDIGEL